MLRPADITAIPFGNGTRLLQCGGAGAKLPRSLVKLETNQFVTDTSHRVGIAFGLGFGRGF